MIKLSDLYTQEVQFPIQASGLLYGTAIVRYEVRKYTDVRNLAVRTGYLVSCTQRLRVPNRAHSGLIPAPAPTGYEEYPALIYNEVTLRPAIDKAATATLVHYSPKTLNASVVSSRNLSSSAGSSFEQQHTSGSATSQTNTFGVSGSIGFFGDVPTGDFGGSYQSSSTTESSTSDTQGRSQSQGSELSDSASMSIKDWACFATIDAANQHPSWTWSQEYPWNVVQFRSTDAQHNILLPDFVLERLYQKPAKGQDVIRGDDKA